MHIIIIFNLLKSYILYINECYFFFRLRGGVKHLYRVLTMKILFLTFNSLNIWLYLLKIFIAFKYRAPWPPFPLLPSKCLNIKLPNKSFFMGSAVLCKNSSLRQKLQQRGNIKGEGKLLEQNTDYLRISKHLLLFLALHKIFL